MENFIVKYLPKGYHLVTVGSVWDYNQALDNAKHTRGLKVKAVHDGKRVEFEQKMPFRTYGVDYFDGYIFKLIRR